MRATVKRLFLLAGSAACFSTALADIPAALDRVPANAPVAMAVQNIEKFDAKFKKLTAVFGPAADANPDMAAVASLLNTPGLNRSGSLAVAVMEDPAKPEGAAAPDPMNGDDMLQNGPVVVIVPVTDLPPIYRDSALVQLERNTTLSPAAAALVGCIRERAAGLGILVNRVN